MSDARKRELTELHHALLRRVQCLCPVPETLYRPLGAECSRLLPELAQPPTPGSGSGPDAEGPASAEGGRAGTGSGAGAGRAAGAGAGWGAPFPPTRLVWAGPGAGDAELRACASLRAQSFALYPEGRGAFTREAHLRMLSRVEWERLEAKLAGEDAGSEHLRVLALLAALPSSELGGGRRSWTARASWWGGPGGRRPWWGASTSTSGRGSPQSR